MDSDLLGKIEKEWTGKATQLKHWLEIHPEGGIPELQLLGDHDWIDAIYPVRLESEAEYRQAISNVRANAELRVLDRLAGALQAFAVAQSGHQPKDIPELVPYLRTPLSDDILARYQMVRADSLVSELRGTAEWVITQRTPVDREWDTRFAIGLGGGGSADSRVANRWGPQP